MMDANIVYWLLVVEDNDDSHVLLTHLLRSAGFQVRRDNMIAVIVNPKSAGGKTAQEWPQMQKILNAEFEPLEVCVTEHRLHATTLTRQALKSGAETVIAIGGDGMLNEVLNGFFEHGNALNQSAKLAFFSRGTGSDFIRSWGQAASFQDFVRTVKGDISQACDVIRIRLYSSDGKPEERYCINMADAGVGGLVVEMVNRRSKFIGGTLSFLLAGIQAALTHKNFPLELELDGKMLGAEAPHFLVGIANGSYFGGGMQLAPQAKLDDGLFDVVVAGDLTIPEKIHFAVKLYKGQIGELPKVRVLRGKHLEIRSQEHVFIDADGELVGTCNAMFDLLPAAISLIKTTGISSMQG